MTKWTPSQKPFRVLAIRRASDARMHGWGYEQPDFFATLEEAKAHAATVKARKVDIHQAMNAATWNSNGYWKKIV